MRQLIDAGYPTTQFISQVSLPIATRDTRQLTKYRLIVPQLHDRLLIEDNGISDAQKANISEKIAQVNNERSRDRCQKLHS